MNRTRTGAIGDMTAYTQVKAAQGLLDAAKQERAAGQVRRLPWSAAPWRRFGSLCFFSSDYEKEAPRHSTPRVRGGWQVDFKSLSLLTSFVDKLRNLWKMRVEGLKSEESPAGARKENLHVQ